MGAVKDQAEDDAVVHAYTLKEVDFLWRGQSMRFALSHGIFSSNDIDPGTRLLLKAVSLELDGMASEKRLLPSRILDAGCGCGVIGIALARALLAAIGSSGKKPEALQTIRVRAQDRDELARAFTIVNARRNGLDNQALEAFAEPLIAGPPDARYDLILSNLPAKAGQSVLKDFILRSPGLLSPCGQVAVVIVNTLAAEVQEWIAQGGAPLRGTEKGEGHTVFIFGCPPGTPGTMFPASPPSAVNPYFRGKARYETAGVGYELESLHGVSDFDQPGTDSVLASLLFDRLLERGILRTVAEGNQNGPEPAAAQKPARILVHEGAHGHFPVRLVAASQAQTSSVGRKPPTPWRFILTGRNVLALDIQARNVRAAGEGDRTAEVEDRVEDCVPVADLELAAERLLRRFGCLDAIVAFPEIVPRVEWTGGLWNAVRTLLAPGGILLVSVRSTEAERFDRCRPAGFAREGEIKRDGFRALAYRRVST